MPIILNISKEKIKEYIRENGADMTADEMANKLVISRTTILRIINEMKATEPDFKRNTHRDIMALRLQYIRTNLDKPVNKLARELSITEKYTRFLIRTRIMMTPIQTPQRTEHHHNGFFNVNARWCCL